MNEVLDTPMQENDANATTIRGYFKALLKELWREGEGFSGKRPFGNSGWESELYLPLVKGGFVKGVIDSHGYLTSCDYPAANKLIDQAIDAL